MKLIYDVPTPPGQLNPNIPAVLKEIIMRCLEKEPERRFRDGSELAQSLAVLLQAERVRNTMRPHPSYPCMRVDRWVATLCSTEDVGMETWSEPILPDTRGSQLPAQSGQRKSTATLADIKPSCSFLARRLTSASLRGLGLVRLIASKKTAGFCWSEAPGSSSTRHCGIGRLKLCWRPISQTGM